MPKLLFKKEEKERKKAQRLSFTNMKYNTNGECRYYAQIYVSERNSHYKDNFIIYTMNVKCVKDFHISALVDK